jgi:hypothetical protein
MSFDSADNKTNVLEDALSDCPSYSTQVTWDCGSTCLTAQVMTGSLWLDARGGLLTKPTTSEMIDFANDQNDLCD